MKLIAILPLFLVCTLAAQTGSISDPHADFSPAPVTDAQTTKTLLRNYQVDNVPPAVPLDLGTAPDPLNQAVPFFRPIKQPIESAILGIASTYGINLVPEDKMDGFATYQLTNVTVRQVLDSLTIPYGYYWRLENGIYYVRHFETKFYHVNYPRIQRTSQSSSSINLSPSTGSNNTASNGTNTGVVASGGNYGGSGTSGGSGTDATTVTVNNSVTGDIWDGLEAQIKQLLGPGELVTVNKFSGIVSVVATPYHQETVKSFLKDLNERVNRRIKIEARIIEVTLNDDHKLGVDWSLANSRAGGALNFLSGSASTATDIMTLASSALPANTLAATVTGEKVSAVIHALSEQGDVRSASNPELETLNNQPATIKVGSEKTFFSLSSTYSLTQASSTVPTSSSQNVYQQNTVTFGTVMDVTPTVNDDGTITLSIMPAITSLAAIDTSPDGLQQAPETDIKTATTIVNVEPGKVAMVGGLIFNSVSRQTSSVPFLGKLPLLGAAFRTDASVKQRTETIIFLTATQL